MLRVDVLPAREESEELRRGHRLDFPAETVERVVVDAREQPAVAPRPLAVDARAQQDAFPFELEEERIVSRHRAERLHPAAQDRFRIARGLPREPAVSVAHDAAAPGELV